MIHMWAPWVSLASLSFSPSIPPSLPPPLILPPSSCPLLSPSFSLTDGPGRSMALPTGAQPCYLPPNASAGSWASQGPGLGREGGIPSPFSTPSLSVIKLILNFDPHLSPCLFSVVKMQKQKRGDNLAFSNLQQVHVRCTIGSQFPRKQEAVSKGLSASDPAGWITGFWSHGT